MERREERKFEMICPKCSQVIEVRCREEMDLNRKKPQPAPEKATRKGIRCH